MKQLLPKVPKYFRTNLHTHTNITDASKTSYTTLLALLPALVLFGSGIFVMTRRKFL